MKSMALAYTRLFAWSSFSCPDSRVAPILEVQIRDVYSILLWATSYQS